MSNPLEITRYILSYILGFGMFLVAIPLGLWWIASSGILPINLNFYVRLTLALPFLCIGLFYVLWSNLDLFRIGKGGPVDGFNVALSPRSKHLVVTGPYAHTRNPMVFGAFMFYFGIALAVGSWVSLSVAVIIAMLAGKYLKATEEKRLLRDFGEEYTAYCKRVSRIIPDGFFHKQ